MSTKLINAKKGDKFRAEQLDYSDIGKEIRVTAKSGATVTDRLVGISAGRAPDDRERVGRVGIAFLDVMPRNNYEFGPYFYVDPTALVTVTKLAEVSK